MPDGMGVVSIFAAGTARRLREFGADDSALGTDEALAFGSAVESGSAVAPADEAARGRDCSPRNFPTLALPDVVELGSEEAVASAEDATTAGEVLAWAEGRLEFRAEAGPTVAPPVVELVADGRDDCDEPSSAQAIPHVVKIAAPTPRATASPPTRPMHIEGLIVTRPGSRKVLQW